MQSGFAVPRLEKTTRAEIMASFAQMLLRRNCSLSLKSISATLPTWMSSSKPATRNVERIADAPKSDRSKLLRAVAEAKTLFEKWLGPFEHGISDGTKGSAKLMVAKAALRAAEDDLAFLDTAVSEVVFDTATLARYRLALQSLMASLTTPDKQPDAAALDAIRSLVYEIIVSPVTNDEVPVEVRGA